MIDTAEAGGGSYPEPPESKQRCYTFDCEVSCKARITVYAENVEQAREYCDFKNCDDYDIYDKEVEEILSYEEEI